MIMREFGFTENLEHDSVVVYREDRVQAINVLQAIQDNQEGGR